jgi:hypothetical protein
MNKVRKSLQDFDEKFNNMGEKFNKEIEIIKTKGNLEMKSSINQI